MSLKPVGFMDPGSQVIKYCVRKILAFWILVLFLFFLVLPCNAENLTSSSGVMESPPEASAALGIVIIDVGNFDYSNATFQSTFWLWSKSASRQLDALENLDIANSLSFSILADYSEDFDNIFWRLQKIRATLRNNWDLADYPFDAQKLVISLEEGMQDVSSLTYVVDDSSKSYYHEPDIQGWDFKGLDIVLKDVPYHSNFGNPADSHVSGSSFAGAKIIIDLKRSNSTALWRLTAGALISVVLIIASLMLSFEFISHVNARFGLLAGSAFASVISLRNYNSKIGAVSYITFVDKIHFIPLAGILVAVIITVINLRLYSRTNDVKRTRQIDKYAALAIGSGGLAAFSILMFHHY